MFLSRISKTLLLLFLLLLIVPSTYAATVRTGETVTFSSNETSDGSLFIAGSHVKVQGDVRGDLFCTGQEIEITGVIHGDVLCAGQTVRISGPVTGDVRLAGQMVSLKNTIGNNVSLAGQTLYLEPQASVSGEIGFLAQTFRLEGKTNTNLFGMAESAILSGQVGKDVTLETETIELTDTAKIMGNFTYVSDQSAKIAPGASVIGTTSRKEPEVKNKPTARVSQVGKVERGFRGAAFIVTSLIVGGIMLLIARKNTQFLVSRMKQESGAIFIRGLFFIVIVPVVLIVLTLTIIGIPLALIAGTMVVFLYFLARSLSAMVVGSLLLERLWEKKKDSLSVSLILGVIVVWSLSFIPVVGSIVTFLLTLYGFGGVTMIVQRTTNKKK